MVKLERGEKPAFWTQGNIQKWTQNWQKNWKNKTSWNWPQVDKRKINLPAKEAMLSWHHHKCAFCEIQYGDNLQIEHFQSKQHYPNEAFNWSNLFLSCPTCNQTKGEQDHRDCLKPDVDDPAEYLWVDPIALKIVPRPGIDENAKKRAEYTIRLYGLDRPELNRAYLIYWRKAALHQGPPPTHELTMSNPNISWIAQFIRGNLPEIETRTLPTEEYSLMTLCLISYIKKVAGL